MPAINITLATTLADLLAALPSSGNGTPPPARIPTLATINSNLPGLPPFMYGVNAVSPPGTRGTSVMPLTGHVLSDPHPEIGEEIMDYYLRTSAQTGGDPVVVVGVAQQSGPSPQVICDQYAGLHPAVPNPAGWVDPYAQPQPSSGGGTGGTGSIPWGSLTDEDKMYAIATFNRRPGTNVPAAIAGTFSGAADWSNFKEANEYAIGNFDIAAYEAKPGTLAGKI